MGDKPVCLQTDVPQSRKRKAPDSNNPAKYSKTINEPEPTFCVTGIVNTCDGEIQSSIGTDSSQLNPTSTCCNFKTNLLDAVHSNITSDVVHLLETCPDSSVPESLLNSALKIAIENGNLFLVQNLIFYGAVITNDSFLKVVCEGHVDILESLVSYFPDKINCRDDEGNSPLIISQSGNVACQLTRILVNSGADVNLQNNQGETALMKALQKQNVNSVTKLLKAGATLGNGENESSSVSLLAQDVGMASLIACLSSNVERPELCTECVLKGVQKFNEDIIDFADPSQEELYHRYHSRTLSPVVQAVLSQNTEALQLLVMSRCFNVNERDESGDRPLNMLFNSKLKEYEHLNIPSCHKRGVAINKDAFTPKELTLLKLLLKGGADITAGGRCSKEFNVPLLSAVHCNDVDLVRIMLKNQTNNISNYQAICKALEIAIQNSNKSNFLAMFEILTPLVKLSMISNWYERSNQPYKQVFAAALDLSDPERTELLRRLFALMPDEIFNGNMEQIVAKGNLPILKMVKDANRNKFDKLIKMDEGASWLNAACDCGNLLDGGHYDVVHDLLVSGADPDKCTGEPIMSLSKWASPSLVQLVISFSNASVDRINKFLPLKWPDHPYNTPNTALKWAVTARCAETVEVLLKHGAVIDSDFLTFCTANLLTAEVRSVILAYLDASCIDTLDSFGKSPLCEAIQNERYRDNKELVKSFLEMGADANIVDHESNTPIIYAASSCEKSIVQLLIEKGANVNHRGNGYCSALIKANKLGRFDIFCTLLEAGAECGTPETANDCLLTDYLLQQYWEQNPNRQLEYIDKLFQHGALREYDGNCSLYRGILYTVHRAIFMSEFGYLFSLIHHGGFAPAVLETSHSVFLYMEYPSFYERFRGILSPFCAALLCGHFRIAEQMIEIGYLTHSDLTRLPRNLELNQYLIQKRFFKCFQLLTKLHSPSLFQLCFSKISDAIAKVDRNWRVEQLGLPPSLQRALMFSPGEIVVGKRDLFPIRSFSHFPNEFTESQNGDEYMGNIRFLFTEQEMSDSD